MKAQSQTIQSWIEAAFRALTKGGPQAIRAEAIARDLGVSKGSFYWHFKNVPALKDAMLVHWKTRATSDIIQLIQLDNAPAQGKLSLLITHVTGVYDLPYGGAQVEAAIRDWARYDAKTAEVVHAVDAQRLAFLRDLFDKCGIEGSKCQTHANLLYAALIGLEALSQIEGMNRQADLQFLLSMLLSQR